MRISVKGGIWKNSEDEILKAAVMKYGLNNWSRVASLLVRKSAKQCKSRWYEWLDPSVKKTEWSREEEEKLLHLAKLFPNQWRTIAPIVGRTAHQCLDRYDKLLDQAQGRTEDDKANDPRRLRPGEIDPHPETKPSRADAVDMDDDEREMLAEARARLANTRGKKAKRKAREKQLEEARRLASLQKRRELKAAGIAVGRLKRRRNDGIDYANEVPFETQPPKGFYAVAAEETPEVNRSLANVSLQQMEGVRRREEERRLRREDARKLKRLMEDDLPKAMQLIENINDPDTFRKRTKLSLPAPQLTEAELDEILEIEGSRTQLADSHASQLLMGEPPRGLVSFSTPVRENTVLLEAQNAVARTFTATPLEGGANTQLHEVAARPAGTPNALTQLRSGTASSSGQTPLGSHTPSSLGLNAGAFGGIQGIDALIRLQVKQGMAELPEPQHEIEVSFPDDVDMPYEHQAVAAELDAEEVQRQAADEAERKLLLERRKQTQVVQQSLPRPLWPEKVVLESSEFHKLEGSMYLQHAEELLHEEMMKLVVNDAIKHPIPIKGLRCPRDSVALEDFDLDDIGAAAALLEVENSSLMKEPDDEEEFARLLHECWDDALEVVVNKENRFLFDAPSDVRLSAVKSEFQQLKNRLVKETQKAKKSETKLQTLTRGYMKRAAELHKSIESSWNEAQELKCNLSAYKKLEEMERVALETRKTQLVNLVAQEKQRHSDLQLLYAAVLSRRGSSCKQMKQE